MGFYKPDSAHLPTAVRKAAKSVFAVTVPAGKRVSVAEIFGNHSLEKIAAKILATPESENLSPAEKAVLLYQIRNCIQQQSKKCNMFEGVSLGSAFVTGDGRDLRTALHVIEDFARDARATGASDSIPIFILDQKGDVLFGPHNLKATVAATYEGALDADLFSGRDEGRFGLDQVLIKLERPIALPLIIADQPLMEGEEAFIAGVPKKTDDRAGYKVPDSDGMSVRISKGTVLRNRSLIERLETAGLSIKDSTAANLQNEATTLTADGAPGLSGGAILNKQGEVVGVYNAGLPVEGTAEPNRISYGSNSLISPPN